MLRNFLICREVPFYDLQCTVLTDIDPEEWITSVLEVGAGRTHLIQVYVRSDAQDARKMPIIPAMTVALVYSKFTFCNLQSCMSVYMFSKSSEMKAIL